LKDSLQENNSLGTPTEVLSEDFDTGLGGSRKFCCEPRFQAAEVEGARDGARQFNSPISNAKDQCLRARDACAAELFGVKQRRPSTRSARRQRKKMQVTDLEGFHRKLAVLIIAVVAVYWRRESRGRSRPPVSGLSADGRALAHWPPLPRPKNASKR